MLSLSFGPFGIPRLNEANVSRNNLSIKRPFNFKSNVNYSYRGITMVKATPEPVPVPTPAPSNSPLPGWKWIVGILFTVILPSFRKSKWGPLLILKENIDKAINVVEQVEEVVEEIAEGVDKVAEEIEEKLPEDSNLKETIEGIEHLAEQAVKYSEQADQFIHKVKDIEEEVVEEVFEGENTNQQGNNTTNNKDQK